MIKVYLNEAVYDVQIEKLQYKVNVETTVNEDYILYDFNNVFYPSIHFDTLLQPNGTKCNATPWVINIKSYKTEIQDENEIKRALLLELQRYTSDLMNTLIYANCNIEGECENE